MTTIRTLRDDAPADTDRLGASSGDPEDVASQAQGPVFAVPALASAKEAEARSKGAWIKEGKTRASETWANNVETRASEPETGAEARATNVKAKVNEAKARATEAEARMEQVETRTDLTGGR